MTSKERLAKQRRPQQSTNENRSSLNNNNNNNNNIINNGGTTNATTSLPLNSSTPMTPRSNASFISSLFSNTNSACKS